MGKTKDINTLKPSNTFTVSLFEGRLILEFEANSMLKRITGQRLGDEISEMLKTDLVYGNGMYDQVKQFTAYFGLVCATLKDVEWHPKGDEQPGLVWFADRLQHWNDLSLMEKWAVRMEVDVSYWDAILDGFLDQKVINIPIESRPAELLTDEERAESLNPKVVSSNNDGDGNAAN